MCERAVDFSVAAMVASRRAEPTMRALIVAVELDALDRISASREPFLIAAAQQSVAFVPLVERLEERFLSERSADALIIEAHLPVFLAAILPQRGQLRHNVVTHASMELRGEIPAPRLQGRELILKRAYDHGSEVSTRSPLEFAVDGVDQGPRGGRLQVVEATAFEHYLSRSSIERVTDVLGVKSHQFLVHVGAAETELVAE